MIKYNKINNNKTLNKLYKKYKLINIDSKYNGYTKLYVDFETTHYINNIGNKFLYMIGIGYYIKNKWVFHNLVTERMNEDSEKSIILQFINIIKQFDKSVLIHWSNAEPSILNKLLNKYNINYNINWCDLLKIYIEKEVIMKDCFNFKLKNIAKNMYKHKLINLKWEDETINGLDAIVVAIKAEKLCSNNIIKSMNDYEYMDIIVKYNEIDCKILSKMINN